MARTTTHEDGTVTVDTRTAEELAHDIADDVREIKELLKEIRDALKNTRSAS